eukprot:gene11694-13808_t
MDIQVGYFECFYIKSVYLTILRLECVTKRVCALATLSVRQIKAKRIFDFFDKNEDGRLNSEEFQAYADVVCGNFEPDLDSFWNDHVKFLAGDDVDDDQGGLSFTGFYQNLCANMSEAQIEADALKLGNPTTKDNFRTVFDFFDQDRDGRLDKKELTLLAVTGAHGTSFYGKNLWEYLEAPPNETVEYLTSELLYAFYGEYVDCMSFEMFLECGCEYLPSRGLFSVSEDVPPNAPPKLMVKQLTYKLLDEYEYHIVDNMSFGTFLEEGYESPANSSENHAFDLISGAIDFEKLEKAMELANSSENLAFGIISGAIDFEKLVR